MTKKKSTFSPAELIKEVKANTKIGKLMTKVELEYLRGMKNIV